MILVLGGTADGRAVASALTQAGRRVLVTVVSEYGRDIIPPGSAAEVLVSRLDRSGLVRLIREKGIKLVADATHPYAREITANAWAAARETDTPYIRFERAGVQQRGTVHLVSGYREAAELAVTLGETLFLTIGSNHLEPFITESRRAGKRLVARVLPDPGVLSRCAGLGLPPSGIVAMQGPFSPELNLAMFRDYQADVLVTKDSGVTGGTDTKLQAAAQLGIPVVMVARPVDPEIPVTGQIDDILEKAALVYGTARP